MHALRPGSGAHFEQRAAREVDAEIKPMREEQRDGEVWQANGADNEHGKPSRPRPVKANNGGTDEVSSAKVCSWSAALHLQGSGSTGASATSINLSNN